MVEGARVLDLCALTRQERYDLMNQIVVPRPIAWVLSGRPSSSGSPVWNLAPFSYFNAVSSDPPIVVLGINSREHALGLKDTARNLRAGGPFTLSIPSSDAARAVAQTSGEFPPDESEASAVGVDLVEFPGWTVPRVASARIALGCTPVKEVDLGEEALCVVLSRVETVWLSHEVAPVGTDPVVVNLARLDPLARAGRGQFVRLAGFWV